MSQPTLPHDLTVFLPDPDRLRAAIDATDRQARLLRRLLRLSVQLHSQYPTTVRPLDACRPLKSEEGRG